LWVKGRWFEGKTREDARTFGFLLGVPGIWGLELFIGELSGLSLRKTVRSFSFWRWLRVGVEYGMSAGTLRAVRASIVARVDSRKCELMAAEFVGEGLFGAGMTPIPCEWGNSVGVSVLAMGQQPANSVLEWGLGEMLYSLLGLFFGF
jgi:hypothetical protein